MAINGMIQQLRLAPGDVVLVSYSEMTTRAQARLGAKDLAKRLKRATGRRVPVVAVPPTLTVLAVASESYT